MTPNTPPRTTNPTHRMPHSLKDDIEAHDSRGTITDQEPLLMNVGELTKLTGLPRRTIQRMCAEGTFPRPVKLPCRRTLWYRPRVLEYLEQLDRESQQE